VNFVLNNLLITGLPAVLAGVLWLVGGRLPRAHGWLSAPAVGLGMGLVYWLMLGKPAFPPTDAQEWVFWLALGLIPLGWLAGIAPAYRWVAGWGLVLVMPWVFVLLFSPLMRTEYWALSVGVVWILVFGVGLAILTLVAAPAEERLAGWQTAFLLALIGGVSAGVLFYGAKSASFAQMGGSLGAIVGIGVPIGWVMRSFRLGRGAIAVAVMLYGILWALGFAYASLQAPYLLAFALCVLTLAIPVSPIGRRLNPTMRFVLPLIGILLVGGAAVGLSYQAYMAAGSAYYY
jgi:hypothetical protein